MDRDRTLLYDRITKFAQRYGCHRFNDAENHNECMNLVDQCLVCGLIPVVNRNEFSTHGCLEAAIVYEDNRRRFCYGDK